MQNIILIGAGGHCRACIDVIERENKYNILGLIDLKENIGKEVLGYKIIDCDDNIEKYVKKGNCFLITIGQITSPEKRIKMYNNLKKLNAEIATVISPLSYVSKHSSIDEGTIVLHDVVINANVKVGKNCIINTKSLLEHDVVVNDNCHVSTGAIVNGGCRIAYNTFVGSNSVIVQGTSVKENSFIKAGSLVK